MCFIAAWKSDGPLPRGLISRLFIEGQARGVDAAGLAWRVTGSNDGLKRAIRPSKFVLNHQHAIREARKSSVGLIHTRRASPRMPLTTAAAQPLYYGKTIYAHNGYVSNWKLERSRAVVSAEVEEDRTRSKVIDDTWITDSYVLGPRLDDGEADLSDLAGSMAIVWIVRDNTYGTRLAKELEGFMLEWTGEDGKPAHATAFASTVEIMEAAVDRLKTEVTVVHVPLEDGKLYQLTPTEIIEIGDVPHSPSMLQRDKRSSLTLPLRTSIADADKESA